MKRCQHIRRGGAAAAANNQVHGNGDVERPGTWGTRSVATLTTPTRSLGGGVIFAFGNRHPPRDVTRGSASFSRRSKQKGTPRRPRTRTASWIGGFRVLCWVKVEGRIGNHPPPPPRTARLIHGPATTCSTSKIMTTYGLTKGRLEIDNITDHKDFHHGFFLVLLPQ